MVGRVGGVTLFCGLPWLVRAMLGVLDLVVHMCGQQPAVVVQLVFLALFQILRWLTTLLHLNHPAVTVVAVKVVEGHITEAVVAPVQPERELDNGPCCSGTE